MTEPLPTRAASSVASELFVRRTRIPAPAAEVFAWHAREGALERLTPPWERVRVLEKSGGIETGARVVLQMGRGPTAIRWVAEHCDYVEGEQFRDLHPDFRELRCEIYGVSRDSLKAHESFKSKMKFPFDLVSDTEETACRLFDVIKLKNMYGRKVRGIERSTFVIDARGIVRRAWRGVKVPDHAREVLEFVKTLK